MTRQNVCCAAVWTSCASAPEGVEPNERPVEAIHAGQRESGRAVVFALWTLLGLVLSETFLRLHVLSSLAAIVALQLLNLQQPR